MREEDINEAFRTKERLDRHRNYLLRIEELGPCHLVFDRGVKGGEIKVYVAEANCRKSLEDLGKDILRREILRLENELKQLGVEK